MKTLQTILLAITGVLFLTFNVHATMFFARPYDPNLQRWLTRDPLGEQPPTISLTLDSAPVADLSVGEFAPSYQEQANLYTYVLNNPVNYVDPFGLLTAVVIGGPSPANPNNPSGSPNFLGHASIAVTGGGVYSFGTGSGKDLGGSFTDFLNQQATYRDSAVYILNTTPEQEKAILDWLKKQPSGIKLYPDNCANRVIGALGAGGINLTRRSLASPIGVPIEEPIPKLPPEIEFSLRQSMDYLKVSVPKGTTLPPKFLTGFNPK